MHKPVLLLELYHVSNDNIVIVPRRIELIGHKTAHVSINSRPRGDDMDIVNALNQTSHSIDVSARQCLEHVLKGIEMHQHITITVNGGKTMPIKQFTIVRRG